MFCFLYFLCTPNWWNSSPFSCLPRLILLNHHLLQVQVLFARNFIPMHWEVGRTPSKARNCVIMMFQRILRCEGCEKNQTPSHNDLCSSLFIYVPCPCLTICGCFSGKNHRLSRENLIPRASASHRPRDRIWESRKRQMQQVQWLSGVRWDDFVDLREFTCFLFHQTVLCVLAFLKPFWKR